MAHRSISRLSQGLIALSAYLLITHIPFPCVSLAQKLHPSLNHILRKEPLTSQNYGPLVQATKIIHSTNSPSFPSTGDSYLRSPKVVLSPPFQFTSNANRSLTIGTYIFDVHFAEIMECSTYPDWGSVTGPKTADGCAQLTGDRHYLTDADLRNEVDILNRTFLSEDGVQLIRFRFKAAHYWRGNLDGKSDPFVDCVIDATTSPGCDIEVPCEAEYLQSTDPEVVDTSAINFYIIDRVESDCSPSASSRSLWDHFRPGLLVDYMRLGGGHDEVESHEMGHAFGLGGTIQQDINAPGDRSNIMHHVLDCDANGKQYDCNYCNDASCTPKISCSDNGTRREGFTYLNFADCVGPPLQGQAYKEYTDPVDQTKVVLWGDSSFGQMELILDAAEGVFITFYPSAYEVH